MDGLMAEVNAIAGVDAAPGTEGDDRESQGSDRKKKPDDRHAGEDDDANQNRAGKSEQARGTKKDKKADDDMDEDGADDLENEDDGDDEGREDDGDKDGADDAHEDGDDDSHEDDDEEKGESDEPEGRWPANTPPWVKKRITGLREQLREARARAETAEAGNVTGAVVTLPDDSGLLGVKNADELADVERSHRKNLRTLEDIYEAMGESDWDQRDEEEKPVWKRENGTYTRAQVRAAIHAARERLEDVPQMRQFLQSRDQQDAQARKEYAWLADENSDKRKIFDAAMKKLPWLRRVANGSLIAADAIEGMLLRQARGKARNRAAERGGRSAEHRKAGAEGDDEREDRRPRAGAPAPRGSSGRQEGGKDRKRRERLAAKAERLRKEGSTEALTDVLEEALNG